MVEQTAVPSTAATNRRLGFWAAALTAAVTAVAFALVTQYNPTASSSRSSSWATCS